MARQHTPTTYERLGRRVQQQLAAATHQQRYHVTLAPQPDDDPADWERLIEEFQTHENVSVTPMETGAYLVTWNPEESTS